MGYHHKQEIVMKNKKIKAALKKLDSILLEIEDSAVILSDGMVVSANIVHHIDEEKLGTISASLFSLAGTAAQQFEKDEVESVLIKCKRSYIALFRAGEDAVLAVDFKTNANIDTILEECTKTSETITGLL
jgi:predicted regulator of Ras-like GTPase activity (Roadblock/LC7/MglB family)